MSLSRDFDLINYDIFDNPYKIYVYWLTISWSKLDDIIEKIVVSQLPNFSKRREKIHRFGSDQLDACTYSPNGLMIAS